jgi:adenylosuccinate lyase
MKRLWSDDTKFGLWRQMWHATATAQFKLGVPVITQEQIDQRGQHLADINYERAAEIEKEKKHDVISHSDTFGEAAPLAASIIHFGCTSCDITDNAELIQIRKGLLLIQKRLVKLLRHMSGFIVKHADLVTVGRTHLKAAQPTTVGKRAAMWAQDFLMDLQEISNLIEWLPFRGLKGATGTQASFLEIFKGDRDKVTEMERMVADHFGFERILPVTGQTYTRKIDTKVLGVLASFGASVHKVAQDVRLLQSDGEMEEPFDEKQEGSSAMPHKSNPMRDERACSLARELYNSMGSVLNTQALQAFERTLDDSAGRRRYLSESFLLADALLLIMTNVMQGLVVYPKVIERNLVKELPFLANARIMDRMVELGANRKVCHENLRDHSRAASVKLRTEGGELDLMDRLRGDEYFEPVRGELEGFLSPLHFMGAAPDQAIEFVDQLNRVLGSFPEETGASKVELSV